MISEEQFNEANKIVLAYIEQCKNIAIEIKKAKEINRAKRISECGEHYYISLGGKWSPISQMTCQFCGDKIN